MSETGGTVVIPNLEQFSEFDIEKIPEAYEAFVEKMFDVGGFNKKALAGNGYVIEEASLKGNYIELETFGSEWEMFANSAMNKDRHLELYGSFHDEYGTHLFFARNQNGDSYKYSFEEDSDEFDQDDFDPDVYSTQLKEHEQEWLTIAPEEIKNNFKSVLPYGPDGLYEE